MAFKILKTIIILETILKSTKNRAS